MKFKVKDMKLVGERVMVSPIFKKPKIIMPDSGMPTPRKGRVIISNIEGIEPDEIVYFKRYEWIEIGDKDNRFYLLDRSNIIAKEI